MRHYDESYDDTYRKSYGSPRGRQYDDSYDRRYDRSDNDSYGGRYDRPYDDSYDRRYDDSYDEPRDGAERPRRTYGRHRKKRSSPAWRILPVIQVILTVVLIIQLLILDMFPLVYFAACVAGLAVLVLITWVLTSLRNTPSKVIGTILSLLLCVTLALGNYYLFRTQNTLSAITGSSTIIQTDEVVVVVLDESRYESLNDLDGGTVGIQAVLDRENTDKVLSELDSNLSSGIVTIEYSGMSDMVDALYSGGVDAIIFNESYRDMIEEEEDYEDFGTRTRILDTYVYETEVTVSSDESSSVDVTSEPFILYFSGIDTFGDITAKSRSDVNIMAVVNPTTKQILLVTTPRDYYVQLPFADYAYDKLTHAGIYGIDKSIETLEYLYGLDIDYYMRLNFTGFVNIVDALGGVEVYSDYSFTSSYGGYSFTKGYNYVDGDEALGFVRERHSFGDGDFQRARDQMEMIKAIIRKMASPSILSSYTSLLSSVEDSFTTDMSSSEITALVKMQLADGADWNIQSYSVMGEGTRRTTYSMGSMNLYVTLQDEDSINTAKELIEMVKNGEIIDDSLVGN